MISDKEIFAPTTGTTNALTETTDSRPFDVDGRSRVCHIYPNTGETITEGDSFELRRVLAVDANGYSTRSIKQYTRENGSDVAITLGNERTQFEVLIRGTYVLRKILSTTEAMGAAQTYGNEEGV